MLSIFKPRLVDFLDIFIVALIIFYFLKFLRGTKALRMVYALMFILFVSLIAQILDMRALGLIIDSLKAVWLILFVILFQPEMRNVLAKFGRYKPLRILLKSETEETLIDEIAKACEELSEKNLGALLVFERRIGLREYIETGLRLEAKVSAPLLVSIFTTDSPLHDGACIIQGNQIVAAGCTLPFSEGSSGQSFVGMRHRAGLGITETTDACAVIVSETTGKTSLAYKGILYRDLTTQKLKIELNKILLKEE